MHLESLVMHVGGISQNRIDHDEVDETERDQSSRPKSRWDKLKKRFTPKKCLTEMENVKIVFTSFNSRDLLDLLVE
jgi:hypothetical protein